MRVSSSRRMAAISPAFLPSQTLYLHGSRPSSSSFQLRNPSAIAASLHTPPHSRSVTPNHPLSSLSAGKWFKLICGASSHDTPAIHNLCAVYTAAGADCIDVACDTATVRAARTGIAEGMKRRATREEPLLMVSVNVAEDPHFRKATFDVSGCPTGCARPCEVVCPAVAISEMGVMMDRCYGCGRCVPVCPVGIIETVEQTYDVAEICRVLRTVEAVEIHTGRGQIKEFGQLWECIREAVKGLQVVAISLPDLGGDEVLEYGLRAMWEKLREGYVFAMGGVQLIWQADGRPMSGDIGRGTAHAAVRLGIRMRKLLTRAGVPGEVQPAGGTNDATVPLLRREGMLRGMGGESVAGIAVGGYARKVSWTDRLWFRCCGFGKLETDGLLFLVFCVCAERS